MGASKSHIAFFERGSWYHRIKTLQEDGTTKYSKKGGFASIEEAEASYRKYDAEFTRAYRAYHATASTDWEFQEYLIYWLENIFSARIENTTRMIASYVVYNLLLPNMRKIGAVEKNSFLMRIISAVLLMANLVVRTSIGSIIKSF
jgi:hypothetical protein